MSRNKIGKQALQQGFSSRSRRLLHNLGLTALVCITMVGGFVMVWYTYRMKSLLNHMIDKHEAAFQAAEAFEIALVNQKGFDLVTEKVPDLVILDMRLPGMNGFETFHAIHKIEPKLPVIIMTAYGTTETAIEATKMGGSSTIYSSHFGSPTCLP